MKYRQGKINFMNEQDKAYMAGIIDGDGCIGISKLRRENRIEYRIRVIVTNSNLKLLNWFKDKIGAGCVYEAKTKPSRPDQNESNWNKVHRYQIVSLKAFSLLRLICDYMIVKKERALLALNLKETKGNEAKEELFQKMKSLNERNKKGE